MRCQKHSIWFIPALRKKSFPHIIIKHSAENGNPNCKKKMKKHRMNTFINSIAE